MTTPDALDALGRVASPRPRVDRVPLVAAVLGLALGALAWTTVDRPAPEPSHHAAYPYVHHAHAVTARDVANYGDPVVIPDLPSGPALDPVLLRVRECESGGDYSAKNPRSSASGAWQFLDGTWTWVTGLPAPASAYDRATQDAAAVALWDEGRGASHWQPSRYCWDRR